MAMRTSSHISVNNLRIGKQLAREYQTALATLKLEYSAVVCTEFRDCEIIIGSVVEGVESKIHREVES